MAQLLSIAAPAMVAGLALFAAALLFNGGPPLHAQARGLALFMLVTAAGALEDMLVASGTYRTAPHLLGLAWPLAMLKGPAIFAYVRSMTSHRAPGSTRPAGLPHLVWPLLLGIVLSAPFYLLDGASKAAFMARGESALFGTRSIVAMGVLGVIGCSLALSMAYLVAAFRLLVRHMRRVRDLFSNIEDKSLSWARWVLLVLALAWIWGAAKSSGSLLGLAPASQEVIASALELLWVGALGYFGVLQRPVFGAKPVAVETEAAPRYARSALDAQRMDRLAEKLQSVMQQEKLFADPTLSLRTLSDRVGASENYISQTLNERLGRNFFDFVNAARIAEAARLLVESRKPILQIAMDVGFNSRSTFNAAFRKHQGCPPSAFRAAQPGSAVTALSGPARPDAVG